MAKIYLLFALFLTHFVATAWLSFFSDIFCSLYIPKHKNVCEIAHFFVVDAIFK